MIMSNEIFIVSLVFLGISFIVSAILKSKFSRYHKIPLANGMAGHEIAEKMLRENGIYDVKVTSVEGFLSDHYNPANKTVNLSPDVYNGRSISAAAVAAHECGHAVHGQDYSARHGQGGPAHSKHQAATRLWIQPGRTDPAGEDLRRPQQKFLLLQL